ASVFAETAETGGPGSGHRSRGRAHSAHPPFEAESFSSRLLRLEQQRAVDLQQLREELKKQILEDLKPELQGASPDGLGSDEQNDANVDDVSGFSTEQQQCIASYVEEVQALLPRYHLQSRRFGGISKATKAKAAPVLGAGFGSTATRSLAVFGRQLGLKVHHFDPLDSPKWSDLDLRLNTSCSERHQLNQVNFSELLHETGSDVFLDTPMAELFLDFFAASPSSKVILTLRDSKQWALRRLKNFADAPVPVQSSCGHRLDSLSVEAAAQLFESHQKLVRCVVPPKQLLEVNVFDGALNSTKIARFLGVKPDFYVPFPRVASHFGFETWHRGSIR
ncbi:unnamed protein product, partial [Cladocopium goreaui]